MDLLSHFYYHNKPYADLTDADKAFIVKCAAAIKNYGMAYQLLPELSKLPNFTIRIECTERSNMPIYLSDMVFTVLIPVLNGRQFVIEHAGELYRITGTGSDTYNVEFPDRHTYRLKDYSKSPGNDIRRWSFKFNLGDWDDANLAESLGRLIDKNKPNRD